MLLYRGAWQEWAPHEIEIAVPLSPRDLQLKRQAIFRHEIAEGRGPVPRPDDPREFWQRAEDRNRHTADRLQPARPARVLRHGRLRALERRADIRVTLVSSPA